MVPPKKQRTSALRADIRDGALELLERKGPRGFRARAVAEAAGTSTAAVYELFGDKSGLIQALYEDGYAQLTAQLLAMKQTEDSARDVKELFHETRRFARKRPHLFEVMFSRPFEDFEPASAGSDPARSYLAVVVARVTRWLDEVDSSADPVDVSRVLISSGRGLIIDDSSLVLGSSRASRNRQWELSFDALMAGIAGRR